MRLYIAGPMSGLPELNFPAFHAAAARLRAAGHEAINPAEINVDPASGWAECLKADIPQLLRCDGLVCLPGWVASRGARLEVHIAAELALQLYTLESPELWIPTERCEEVR